MERIPEENADAPLKNSKITATTCQHVFAYHNMTVMAVITVIATVMATQ